MADFVESMSPGGASVLSPMGDVDIVTADAFVDAARSCLDRAPGIELDLGGVTFIDSSGLAALIRIRNEATDNAKSVVLTNVTAATDRLLRITGLHEVLEVRSQLP